MEKGFSQSSSDLKSYVERVFHPEDAVLKNIRERAAKAGLPDIHVGVMDGLHMEVLVRAMGAEKIVEIGTLAGYSGTCLARGLPRGGRLCTFEFEQKHADVAQETFRLAGLEEKVRIFVGPAVDNLKKIEGEGPFDLVFIDADKVSYAAYYEWAVQNLRVGGAVLADNTFAGGKIVEGASSSADRVRTLHQFNVTAAGDKRVRATILPTSDGLTFAVKL